MWDRSDGRLHNCNKQSLWSYSDCARPEDAAAPWFWDLLARQLATCAATRTNFKGPQLEIVVVVITIILGGRPMLKTLIARRTQLEAELLDVILGQTTRLSLRPSLLICWPNSLGCGIKKCWMKWMLVWSDRKEEPRVCVASTNTHTKLRQWNEIRML